MLDDSLSNISKQDNIFVPLIFITPICTLFMERGIIKERILWKNQVESESNSQ